MNKQFTPPNPYGVKPLDNYTYLRPLKKRIAIENMQTIRDMTGKLKIQNYNAGIITPGYCYTGTGDDRSILLEEISGGGARYTPGNGNKDVAEIRGTVLYAGYFYPMWGHFLVQSLARLWYYFNSTDRTIDKIVFVSDNPVFPGFAGNIKTFLRLAGIDSVIEVITKPTFFEKIIVPDHAFSHKFFSKEFMYVYDLVKRRALETPSEIDSQQIPIKLFMTRSALKNASKNEININLLDQFFKDNGFAIISPEKIGLVDLIKMFNRAQAIASICGTLAHNILFADKGVDFTIVERHACHNSWQVICNHTVGIGATFVDCFRLPMMPDPIGSLFLYQATDQMLAFVADRNMIAPKFPESRSERKKEIRKYLNAYKRIYGYSPYFNRWDTKGAEAFVEAILESDKIYYRWTRRHDPLYWYDYMNPRFYKDTARTILKKFGLR